MVMVAHKGEVSMQLVGKGEEEEEDKSCWDPDGIGDGSRSGLDPDDGSEGGGGRSGGNEETSENSLQDKDKAENVDRITSLPDDVLIHILGFIGDAKSVFHCGATCHVFYRLLPRAPVLSFKDSTVAEKFDVDDAVTSAVLKCQGLSHLLVETGSVTHPWKLCSPTAVRLWMTHTHASLCELSVCARLKPGTMHDILICTLMFCRRLQRLEVSPPRKSSIGNVQELDWMVLRTCEPQTCLRELRLTMVGFGQEDEGGGGGAGGADPAAAGGLNDLLALFPNLVLLQLVCFTGLTRTSVVSTELRALCVAVPISPHSERWAQNILVDAPQLEEVLFYGIRDFEFTKRTNPGRLVANGCHDLKFSFWSDRLLLLDLHQDDDEGRKWHAIELIALLMIHRHTLVDLHLHLDVWECDGSTEDIITEAFYQQSFPLLEVLHVKHFGLGTLLQGLQPGTPAFNAPNLRDVWLCVELQYCTTSFVETFLTFCPKIEKLVVELKGGHWDYEQGLPGIKQLQQDHPIVDLRFLS